jgi:hypothetical protein
MGLSGSSSSAFKRDASKENSLADQILLVKHCGANGIEANPLNVGMGETVEIRSYVAFEITELQIQQSYDLRSGRLFEKHYFVEAPPNGGIELPLVVRGRNDKSGPFEFFDQRQQAVHDPPQFAVQGIVFPKSRDRIELVEQQNDRSRRRVVEDLAEIGSRFAKKG